MKLKMIVLLAATIVVALTACKGVRTSVPEPLPFPNVLLPSDFKNADPSPQLDKSAAVLSLLDATHIWVGPNEFDDVSVFDIVENRVNRAQQKMVYIRAQRTLDYAAIVKAIDTARKAGVLDFALQVQKSGAEPHGQFTVKVLPEPPVELSQQKNPALVGVILSPGSKIELVKGGMEHGLLGPGGTKAEAGTLNDTSRLAQALTQTLADRTDRKVTIKPFRTARYTDVLAIIDAVKGAGAGPIVLQIDDLP